MVTNLVVINSDNDYIGYKILKLAMINNVCSLNLKLTCNIPIQMTVNIGTIFNTHGIFKNRINMTFKKNKSIVAIYLFYLLVSGLVQDQ